MEKFGKICDGNSDLPFRSNDILQAKENRGLRDLILKNLIENFCRKIKH